MSGAFHIAFVPSTSSNIKSSASSTSLPIPSSAFISTSHVARSRSNSYVEQSAPAWRSKNNRFTLANFTPNSLSQRTSQDSCQIQPQQQHQQHRASCYGTDWTATQLEDIVLEVHDFHGFNETGSVASSCAGFTSQEPVLSSRFSVTTVGSNDTIMYPPATPTPHWSMQPASLRSSSQPKDSNKSSSNGNIKSLKRAFSNFKLSSSPSSKESRKIALEHSTSLTSLDVKTGSTLRREVTFAPEEKTPTSQKLNFAEQVAARSRKMMNAVRRKLSSKTPASELPKTWEDYSQAYANYEIDIEDPPLPPMREAAEGTVPTPYQARAYVAPLPHNEADRQAVVNKLDLFGRKSPHAANSASVLTISMPTSSAMVQSHSASSFAPSESSSSRPSSISPDSMLRRRSFDNSSMYSTATSVRAETEAANTATAVASLQNYPAFREIVQRCQKLFDVRVGMLTVLDEEQQLFLATGGLPEPVEQGGALPRAVTFCSHAILNEERGMVVLDSQKDWRFANALPSAALGARFYAGVPLLAPNFGDENAPNVAIGTLCAVDDRPHDTFSEDQRNELRALAAEATKEIENWVNERMAAKLNRLESAFAQSTATLPPPAEVQESDREPSQQQEVLTNPLTALVAPPQPSTPTKKQMIVRPPRADRRPRGMQTPMILPVPQAQLPDTPPDSLRGSRKISHGRQGSDSTTFSDTASSNASIYSNRSSARPLNLAVTTDDPVTSIPKELQKIFDQATRMLAKALSLDLVYLVSLDLALLNSGSNSDDALRVLSSHGMPSPAPAFDPALHLKALRAPEGGLLYSNPRFSSEDPSSPGYSGGILIPVLEVRRTGYVLSGYSKNPSRQFQQKDLTYFVKFSEQLESYVTRLGRSTGSQLSLGDS